MPLRVSAHEIVLGLDGDCRMRRRLEPSPTVEEILSEREHGPALVYGRMRAVAHEQAELSGAIAYTQAAFEGGRERL